MKWLLWLISLLILGTIGWRYYAAKFLKKAANTTSVLDEQRQSSAEEQAKIEPLLIQSSAIDPLLTDPVLAELGFNSLSDEKNILTKEIVSHNKKQIAHHPRAEAENAMQ